LALGGHGRARVRHLEYGANDPLDEISANAWFGVGGPDDQNPVTTNVVDLSAYAGGAISFDYRQLGFSGTLIEAGMECGWPCTSEKKQTLTSHNWQTQTIGIDDLVTSGADITKLNVPFMVSTLWWSQGSGRYQIDNIRLSQTFEKPTVVEPPHPGTALKLNLLEGDDQQVVSAGTYGLTLESGAEGYTVNYTADGGYTWFNANFSNAENITQPKDLSDYYHGDLVVDYTVNSWGEDTEGEMILHASCGYGCGIFPNIGLTRAMANVRTEARLPITEFVAKGLDLTKVSSLFRFKLRNSLPEGISITIHEAYVEVPAP